MRYAIYTRYSAEQQTDISLEAQERQCRHAVQERGGTVVQVYQDVAKTGWSLDRPGFKAMRADAEQGVFDAIMFWKFDRLARDHNHALIIKMLLRHDYGIKLYCVEGFSEDDDNSPYAAMMEQMFAVFSAYYSYNLSTEAKRSKYERVMRGEFNGSIAPLGYDLITRAQETPDRPAGLYVNPEQAVLIKQAFELYSTGNYSDADIADWLNSHELIRQRHAGKKPLGSGTIREILQSQIYIGKVQYKETQWHGTLGEDRKNVRSSRKWFEGKHEAIISAELFEQCQQIRAGKSPHHERSFQIKTYVMQNKVYCARCLAQKPLTLKDDKYGKMRAAFLQTAGRSFYHCKSKYRGYERCEQKRIESDLITEQVIQIFSEMIIPEEIYRDVESIVQHRLENAENEQKIEEIQRLVKDIDFGWQEAFNLAEYSQKQRELRSEWKTRRSNDAKPIISARDLLHNFLTYWAQCDNEENPDAARQWLIDKVLYRVYVYDQQVIALTLYGGFSIYMCDKSALPPQLITAIEG